MKVQDVLLKAMAKKIRWWEAAEILGVSDRTMRRWRERLEEHGYSGLADRRKGKPSALSGDRGSHFFVTPKAGEKVDQHRLTQVGRAMRELGVQMIPAYSPQARGRGERSFGTWQGRLPQELRLAGIRSLEEANQFLRDHYIAEFNAKFQVTAAEKGSAFRRTSRTDLEWVLPHPFDPLRSAWGGPLWRRRASPAAAAASFLKLKAKPKTRKPPSASRRGTMGAIKGSRTDHV